MPAPAHRFASNVQYGPNAADGNYEFDDAAVQFEPGERIGGPLASARRKLILKAGVVGAIALGGGWAWLNHQATLSEWTAAAATAVSSALERKAPDPPAPNPPLPPLQSMATSEPPAAPEVPAASPLSTVTPSTSDSRPRRGGGYAAGRKTAASRCRPCRSVPEACARRRTSSGSVARAAGETFADRLPQCWCRDQNRAGRDTGHGRSGLAATAYAGACTIPGEVRARYRARLPALRCDGDEGQLADDCAAHGEMWCSRERRAKSSTLGSRGSRACISSMRTAEASPHRPFPIMHTGCLVSRRVLPLCHRQLSSEIADQRSWVALTRPFHTQRRTARTSWGEHQRRAKPTFKCPRLGASQ